MTTRSSITWLTVWPSIDKLMQHTMSIILVMCATTCHISRLRKNPIFACPFTIHYTTFTWFWWHQQLAYMQTMGGGGQKICTVMNGCPIPNQFGVNGGPTLQLLVGHLIFLIVFNKNGTCENFKVQKKCQKFNALPIFPSCHTSKNTNRILSHQDVLALCGKISRNLFQDRRTRYQKINKKYN